MAEERLAITRFQVSTRRTGLLRIIPVEVYHDSAEFDRLYERRWCALTTGETNATDVMGSVVPVSRWVDRDPRPILCRLMLREVEPKSMSISLIIHEATHAALHIYSVDGYRDHAKAKAHLRGSNEAIPYMVTDIAGSIAKRLQRLGYDVHTDDAKRWGPFVMEA